MDATALATPGASNSVAAALTAYDPIWLNEIQVESVSGSLDNFGETAPWIELYNSGLTPLTLSGYYLATNYTSNLTEVPLPDMTIAPGEYKVIWADGQPEQTSDGNLHTAFALDYRGTLALVRTLGGQPQITDYLTWPILGANTGYGASPDGQLINRVVLHSPSPGSTNVEPALRVFINEWMTKNTTGIRDPADNNQDDWFEIYNAEARTVNLGGFYLTDDAGANTKFRVPANGRYTIAPGGFLVVFADNQTNQNILSRSNLHVNFQLGSSSGTIALYAPDGLTQVDSIVYGPQVADVSEGRYSDGASARYFMTKSTPSGINVIPGYNTRPLFVPIANQLATNGQNVTLNCRANDADSPAQTLLYSVVSAPARSLVTQNGLFRWIVPTNQPLGEYPITLGVTVNGTPPRSNSVYFTITVRTPTTPPPIVIVRPAIYAFALGAGQATFTFEAVPGRTYRVLYKDDLSAAVWTELDRDFVAANSIASITDILTTPRRFYQVLQID